MNVLPQDKELAEKLWECGCIYLDRARVAWVSARFDDAERWMTEFQRCKRDLDELVRKKEEHDQLAQLVETMKERGIDIMIVMRKGNEQ
jgi:glycine/D-amino acid oxidase-like deaminating enzyme